MDENVGTGAAADAAKSSMRVAHRSKFGTPYVGVTAIAAEIGCALATARRMCAEGRIDGVLRLGRDVRLPYGMWVAPVPIRVLSHDAKVGPGRPAVYDADGNSGLSCHVFSDELSDRLGIMPAHVHALCEAGWVWGARGRGLTWWIPAPPVIDRQWIVMRPRTGEVGEVINRAVRQKILSSMGTKDL